MNIENTKYSEFLNELNEKIEDIFGDINISNLPKSSNSKDSLEQNEIKKISIPEFLIIERETQYKLRIISSPVAYELKLPNNIQPIQKFMAHVIDRSDNKIKIWNFGMSILKQIQELMRCPKIRPFIMDDHDLIIYKNSNCKYNIHFDDKVIFQEIPPNLIDLNNLIKNNPNMFVSKIPTL